MSNPLISNQELLVSNMLEIQAVIRILTRRGISNENEVMEEIIKLQDEVNEKVKKMGKENGRDEIHLRSQQNWDSFPS